MSIDLFINSAWQGKLFRYAQCNTVSQCTAVVYIVHSLCKSTIYTDKMLPLLRKYIHSRFSFCIKQLAKKNCFHNRCKSKPEHCVKTCVSLLHEEFSFSIINSTDGAVAKYREITGFIWHSLENSLAERIGDAEVLEIHAGAHNHLQDHPLQHSESVWAPRFSSGS